MNIFRKFLVQLTGALLLVLASSAFVMAQSAATAVPQPSNAAGISLAPARVELEMLPGAETTVVVNLDYHSVGDSLQPVRIVASLNDWTIKPSGEVEFLKANTLPNSASSWLIYSPGETTVTPGNVHSIRVTITVPKDATPGDHLTSLIVEQRPDSLKLAQNQRQVVVRYRMAAVFYIKVPQLVRNGALENLRAEANSNGIVVTPTLKNQGNTVLRPVTSVKVMNAAGQVVTEATEGESLPVLGGAELSQALNFEHKLAPGTYSVKYRVDFQDGSRPTEGITELVVGNLALAVKTGSEAGPAKP